MSDQTVPYSEYTKMWLHRAFAEKEDGSKPSTDETIMHLATAVFTLATALEELTAPPAPPRQGPVEQTSQQTVAARTLKERWQSLPLPSYVFLKTAGLAMLQELSNTLRRA